MLTRPYLPSPCPLRLLVLLGVVLALALGAAYPRPLAAQPAASIEGTWMLSFPNDDPTLRHLAAFLPGGVVVATNAPTFSEESAHGGRVHSTEGLGVWVRLDDGRYAFTVVYLYYDVEEQPWGTLTVDGVVTLDASGNRFRGTFNVDVVDAIGALLFSSQDEPIAGTRVRVRTIPAGAGAEAGAAATAAALRIFDAVLGPCRSEDPPGGQTRITPSDRLPGADAARWRETAARGIATFVSETCHGGIAGVALGRTATGEWGLLRVPTAGPGPALQLPSEMFVCTGGADLELRAWPDPTAPVVGTVPSQGRVMGEEFVLTVPGMLTMPGIRGRNGSGWYRVSAPRPGWAFSESLFVDSCP